MLRMLLKYFINVNDFVLVVELSISYVISLCMCGGNSFIATLSAVLSGEQCVFSGEFSVSSGGFRIGSSQR